MGSLAHYEGMITAFTVSQFQYSYQYSGRESRSVMSNSLGPHGLYSPWNSPGQNTGVGSLSLLQGNLPNPGMGPMSPSLQVDSLPAEPQRKPKNSEVGTLPLLQGIFPSQESNWALMCCGQIIYQLSYQGVEPKSLLSSADKVIGD